MSADAGTPDRFSRLLRKHRIAAGLTQEELAERAGLSVRAVSDMERGRTARPLSRSLRLLADALQLSGPSRAGLIDAASGWDHEADADGAGLRGGENGQPGVPAGPHRPPVLPRQLPVGPPGFTGRGDELATLQGFLDQEVDRTGGAVVISAIGGAAGVGKTALAVHFARQAAARFPDGQLYVDLRGFGPVAAPATLEEVLGGFLDALGVRPERLPPTVEAQAALYRSLLAEKRFLIILDNAASEQQVRPLLPGSPGCLAIVTSRRQLTGLAAADGARLLTLDVLTDSEARDLLATRIGCARVAAEPAAVAELIRLCAGLPLALAITGARAAARPAFPLAELTAALRETGSRLDALDTGDPVASARAVFSWSYRAMSPPAARMFRLLGTHPGADISAPAAASLAAVPGRQARAALGELTSAHLLTEHSPGRYALHDLLRAYAAEQASAADSAEELRAAARRTLDHYLHTAHAGALLLKPSRDPLPLPPPAPGVTPERLADEPQALDWFEAEHRALSATIARAADSGFDAHAWQLSWATGAFLDRRGHWHEWIAVLGIALAAAQRCHDRAGRAYVHLDLGIAQTMRGSYRSARDHLGLALGLFGERGDRDGLARTHQGLGLVFDGQARHREALDHSRRALALFGTVANPAARASALGSIGWHHAQLGEYRQALVCCRQALELHREVGHRLSEANAWDTMGYAHYRLGHHADAIACYQRALDLYRELGERYYRAQTLNRLGDMHHAAGSRQAARDAWGDALAILADLDHPDADQVRARLSEPEAAGARPDEAAAVPAR